MHTSVNLDPYDVNAFGAEEDLLLICVASRRWGNSHFEAEAVFNSVRI